MVVTESYVQALGRVCENIPSKVVDEIACDMGGVQTNVVLTQTHPTVRYGCLFVLLWTIYKICLRVIYSYSFFRRLHTVWNKFI